MSNRRNIYRRLCDKADLPDEPVPNQPLLEMVGCDRIVIENHKGIVKYGHDCMQISVRFGEVCISGMHLELTRMTKGQLVISGQPENIRIIRRKM